MLVYQRVYGTIYAILTLWHSVTVRKYPWSMFHPLLHHVIYISLPRSAWELMTVPCDQYVFDILLGFENHPETHPLSNIIGSSVGFTLEVSPDIPIRIQFSVVSSSCTWCPGWKASGGRPRSTVRLLGVWGLIPINTWVTLRKYGNPLMTHHYHFPH